MSREGGVHEATVWLLVIVAFFFGGTTGWIAGFTCQLAPECVQKTLGEHDQSQADVHPNRDESTHTLQAGAREIVDRVFDAGALVERQRDGEVFRGLHLREVCRRTGLQVGAKLGGAAERIEHVGKLTRGEHAKRGPEECAADTVEPGLAQPHQARGSGNQRERERRAEILGEQHGHPSVGGLVGLAIPAYQREGLSRLRDELGTEGKRHVA